MKVGHTAHLISAKLVSTIRQNQKTDKNDALAIVQASLLTNISFIKGKAAEQQQLQSILRLRELTVRHKAASGNQLKALLSTHVGGRGKAWLNRQICEEQFVAQPTDYRSHVSGGSGLQTNGCHQKTALDTRAGRTPRQEGCGSCLSQQNSEDGIFYAHSRYSIQGGASSRLKSVPTIKMHKRRLTVSVLNQFYSKSLELVRKI